MLVPGELFPSAREVDQEVEATEMAGVEHLGQYVYEMTQAKVRQVQLGGVVLPEVELGVMRYYAEGEDDEVPMPEEMVT